MTRGMHVFVCVRIWYNFSSSFFFFAVRFWEGSFYGFSLKILSLLLLPFAVAVAVVISAYDDTTETNCIECNGITVWCESIIREHRCV